MQWLSVVTKKTNWNYILISMFKYLIGFEVYQINEQPLIKIDIYIISIYFFGHHILPIMWFL